MFISFCIWGTPSIPVAARSKAWVCGRLLSTNATSNTDGGMMFFSCECCVSLGRGLWDGPITRPEESYRVWCVWVWSTNPRGGIGLSSHEFKKCVTTRHWANPVRNVIHPSSEFYWTLHMTLVLETHTHYRQQVAAPRFSQALPSSVTSHK